MKLHVLVRFGRWKVILDEAFPTKPTLYLNTTALLHYARTVALPHVCCTFSPDGTAPRLQVTYGIYSGVLRMQCRPCVGQLSALCRRWE
jgi:hypothetical protein